MKALTVIAWIAPLLAIPFYFFALMGWGMSATSSPHANEGKRFTGAAAASPSLFGSNGTRKKQSKH